MIFTAEEKYQVALREAKLRRDVYPRLIAKGKMSFQEAQRQTDIMREIAADYDKLARKERLL